MKKLHLNFKDHGNYDVRVSCHVIVSVQTKWNSIEIINVFFFCSKKFPIFTTLNV